MPYKKAKSKGTRRAQARERSASGNPSRRSNISDTRDRALHVLADMHRNPSLTFTQAARNRDIDPRAARKQLGSALRKDSSGRIRAAASDRFHKTLHIPSKKPGVRISISTKNLRERQLVGRWMAALNAAGRGDWSKLKKFPRGQVVGGVRFPTGTHEVQLILNALAEEEAPFEGLYRSIARPS